MADFTRAVTIVALCLVAVGCESGGDEQTRDESDKKQTPRTSSDQSGDDDEAQLLEHPEARPADERLDPGNVPAVDSKLELSDSEWRRKLTPEEFHILREKGTEKAHTGDLLDVDEKGVYYCAACGNPVFSSKHRFQSSSGWPSFWRPYNPKRIELKADRSLGMLRTETVCARCGGHLGHVFDDGPKPTGLRYCINSAALDFKSVEEIRESLADVGPDAGTSGPDAGRPPEPTESHRERDERPKEEVMEEAAEEMDDPL